MIVEVDRLGLHKAVERRAMGLRGRLLRMASEERRQSKSAAATAIENKPARTSQF